MLILIGLGLSSEVHPAGAPGLRGQDTLLQVQRAPGNEFRSMLCTVLLASDFFLIVGLLTLPLLLQCIKLIVVFIINMHSMFIVDSRVKLYL